MKTLYVDGGTRHNGNYRGTQQSRIVVWSDAGVLADESVGNRTNNEAEILAVKRAIELADGEPVHIFSDSQLAVNLINRKWKSKMPHLRLLVAQTRMPKGSVLEWIPRADNFAGNYLETTHAI